MRILFLASYFPRPLKPLIGTWALEQAKALSRVADVQVVCTTAYFPKFLAAIPRLRPWADVPLSYQWENVSVHYLTGLYYPVSLPKRWAHVAPERQLNLAWKSIEHRLRTLCDQFAPDILYAHHTAVNGYFAKRIHDVTGLPFVVTDHDFREITDCEHLPRRRAFYEPIIRNASRNVCVSSRMQGDLDRIFPFARSVTVHNGINLHPSSIFSTPRPPELQGKAVIISAGMFAPRKGFPLLVQAFARVAGKHPDAVLRIAGGGEQQQEIEKTIRDTNMQERVTLLGLRKPADLFQEMAWADLFALLAWDEPFGVVFAEAMGAGIPVLAANDGGINDLVQTGVHGLTVPPRDLDAAANALDDLLTNTAQRREMGRRAKLLVESKLTWDTNSQSMMQIFNQAIMERKTVSRGKAVPSSQGG